MHLFPNWPDNPGGLQVTNNSVDYEVCFVLSYRRNIPLGMENIDSFSIGNPKIFLSAQCFKYVRAQVLGQRKVLEADAPYRTGNLKIRRVGLGGMLCRRLLLRNHAQLYSYETDTSLLTLVGKFPGLLIHLLRAVLTLSNAAASKALAITGIYKVGGRKMLIP